MASQFTDANRRALENGIWNRRFRAGTVSCLSRLSRDGVPRL